MCKTLFGDEGELVIEEIFKLGQCSMTTVIFKAAKRLKMAKKDDLNTSDVIKTLKNKFTELVDCQFLCRIPTPYTLEDPEPQLKNLPKLVSEESNLFTVPDIPFKLIVEAVDKSDEDPDHADFDLKDDKSKILWRINYERFQREFRDQVVVQACDPCAAQNCKQSAVIFSIM